MMIVTSVFVVYGVQGAAAVIGTVTQGAYAIKFDPSSLQPVGAKAAVSRKGDVRVIMIDIAPGKTVRAIRERLEYSREDNTTFNWIGRTEDGKGRVILSVRHGRMVGSVTIGRDRYSIYPEGDHYKVVKDDPDRAVVPGDDTVPSPFKAVPMPRLRDDNASSAFETSPLKTAAAAARAAGDVTVDVLILYTKPMKDKYGADTETKIQNLFAIARTAYADSQTGVALNLVHLQQLPESSPLNNVPSDLSSLNDLATDGYVAYLRRQYGADMVSLMSDYNESGGGPCGKGFTPYQSSDPMTGAFSIVMVRSSSEGNGYYCPDLSFAHELGHNFVCQHDRDHTSADDTGNVLYPYAFGYDIAGEFATIMSYDSPGIAYFSNPDINDSGSGDPIGVADSEDNARTIRNSRLEISDNSAEIDESLESPDHALDDGTLASQEDRDAYFVNLGGTTTFSVANPKYSNTWGYYINIYDSRTHTYIASCENDCQIDLANGLYRVVVTYFNDHTGSYYSGTGDPYAVGVVTDYKMPGFPSIINYLLQ